MYYSLSHNFCYFLTPFIKVSFEASDKNKKEIPKVLQLEPAEPSKKRQAQQNIEAIKRKLKKLEDVDDFQCDTTKEFIPRTSLISGLINEKRRKNNVSSSKSCFEKYLNVKK